VKAVAAWFCVSIVEATAWVAVSGDAEGVTELDAAEALPVPMPLVAVTVNV